MAGKFITLKFEGHCTHCGTVLPVGAKARWYGRGRVYGIGCHPFTPNTRTETPDLSAPRGGLLGHIMSDEAERRAERRQMGISALD